MDQSTLFVLWVARVECVSERKQAAEFVVDDATTSPPELQNANKHIIRLNRVVQCSIFLHERNEKSELDKSALFTFDSIPFFGCPILDFLFFFIVYETTFQFSIMNYFQFSTFSKELGRIMKFTPQAAGSGLEW